MGARQYAVDLIGRIVELAGELAEILERQVDVAPVLPHCRHDVVDLVDDAGDLLRIERFHELIDIHEGDVETLGRIVEVIGERGAVAHQTLEIVRARRERLAERLHIADDVADLVRVDRRDQAIGVLGQGLDLRHHGLHRLADLGQVLERHVDVRRVVGEGLGEDVGALKRRVDRIGIVGEELVGAIDDRDAFRRQALDVVDDRADLGGIDRLDHPVGVVGQGLQARGERPDLLAEFAHALQRRVDSGRVIGQRLGEHIDILDRRMDRRRIVGNDLLGVVQNGSRPDGKGADVVENLL